MRFGSAYIGLLIALVLVGLLAVDLGGQAAQTKTRTGVVEGDDMTLDLKTNQFEFEGHCKLTISGPYQATISAEKMTFKLSPGAEQIENLTTHGPTDFSLVTAVDEEGRRYRVTANAGQGATYSGKQQKVVLRGGASADIIALPEGPQSQRAHFSGQVITADLKTSIIKVNKAHLQVETPLEAE